MSLPSPIPARAVASGITRTSSSALVPTSPLVRPPTAAGSGLEWHSWPGTDAGISRHASLRGQHELVGNLNDCKLVVIGLGAVAGQSFKQFARLGVGRLVGVDFDNYGEASWQTQPCNATDADRSKASVLGEAAHRINPSIEIHTARGFAQDLPLAVLRQADAIVLAGDNLEVAVWAGRMAAALGKPLLQGAVHGETWTCIVRGYDLRTGEGACPACAMNSTDWMNLKSRSGCDPSTADAQGVLPTRTLPHICATAGNLLVAETLKTVAMSDGRGLAGEELVHCLLSHQLWRTTLPRRSDCPCPHARWQLIDIPQNPSDIALSDLLSQLDLDGADWDECLIRAERPWVSEATCGACKRIVAVHRFAGPGADLGECECGGRLIASVWGNQSVIDGEQARPYAARRLSELGIAPGGAVGIWHGEAWRYFFCGGLSLDGQAEVSSSGEGQHSQMGGS